MYAITIGELIDQLEDIRRKEDSAVAVGIVGYDVGVSFEFREEGDVVILRPIGDKM